MLARDCLDWTERKPHLAGALPAALLTRFLEVGWLDRRRNDRGLTVTDLGRLHLPALVLFARRQSPLVEFMPQSQCGLLSQGISHDQHKVDAPRVVMTFTAVAAEPGLARFPAWSMVRAHDMRQFVQAGLLADTDATSAVRADLDPAGNSVGVAAPCPPTTITGSA